MRGNLDRIQADIERLRGDPAPEREGQRRAILVALAQNNCGPQYQQQVAAAHAAAQRRPVRVAVRAEVGLHAGQRQRDAPGMSAPSGTFRTVCVRTCDGFYYPISAATNPGRFADDEKACRAVLPGRRGQLYSHRNPGEDINQAVSVSGQQPYTALPNAFRYRRRSIRAAVAGARARPGRRR